jgi:hypothetical protein
MQVAAPKDDMKVSFFVFYSVISMNANCFLAIGRNHSGDFGVFFAREENPTTTHP